MLRALHPHPLSCGSSFHNRERIRSYPPAQRLFRELGYDNIHLKTGNGYEGWPEHAPYDGIIVTAAASHIPSPLIEQLKPGARLVIPVGEPYSYQKLYLVEKDTGGNIKAREILGVSFVPLV